MKENENSVKTNTNSRKNKTDKKKNYKGVVIGLAIATGILGASSIGFGVAYGVTQSQSDGYSIQLENIYKKNYYELVDNVNNADMKISKLLASDNQTYQRKMLNEVAQEAKDMQNNIAMLPLTGENVLDCVRFVNQLSGYTQTLEEKVIQGENLSQQDLKTLNDLHDSLTEMKRELNRMSSKMLNGYSILGASTRMNGDYDEFTIDFASIKADDTDYPSMIYDGPFSDSVVEKKIRGLTGDIVERDVVYKKIDSLFKNITNLQEQGETNGRFNTYNYSMKNTDGQNLYVQATKIGGHVLTVSGTVESDVQNINLEQAKKIALDFAKENGVKNAQVVWHEILKSQAYFNIAPVQNDIILYPELVKVKVDLEHGDVIGYDAITYFTNHIQRNLPNTGIGIDLAREKVDKSFTIKGQRKVLAPLDFNREVLCYEFECERNGATYYLYYNCSNGQQENVLKVVETDDGSKLM